MRIARRPERRVLSRRAHRELVHVGFADEHRALGAQLRDHGRIERWNEVLKNLRCARRLDTLGRVDVLNPQRYAAKRWHVASCEALVGGIGLLECLALAYGD